MKPARLAPTSDNNDCANSAFRAAIFSEGRPLSPCSENGRASGKPAITSASIGLDIGPDDRDVHSDEHYHYESGPRFDGVRKILHRGDSKELVFSSPVM